MADLLLPVTPRTLFTAAEMVLGFLGAMLLCARFLPGIERRGVPGPDGRAKTYKLTGMSLFFLTHVAVGIATLGFGVSLTPILTHFWSLLIVANAVAVALTLFVVLRGRARARAAGEPPRPLLRDLWYGSEQNPELFGVDLKMFLYQPSLIGLGLVVVAFAYAQHERHGVLTPQTLAFVGFYWAYLYTHYVKEEFMLTTWDIIAERLGFMLIWGDLVYVPFLYSFPGWWLVDAVTPFPPAAWVPLVLLYAAGLWIFREANWQKERYKRDPEAPIWGRPPRVVAGRLLASGWWGIGRKLNYTGEIVVYLCFALCTGFRSPWPYLLPASLVVLLVQRAARDDRRCREKYGDAWLAYCERARFRMFPFVY